MNQVTKFPDMRPATPPRPIHLPPPSGYVQRVPLFPTTDGSVNNRRFERKRLLLWFGIAAAFHAALLLGFWLMPALRIKWEPSPDAWVHVTSLSSARPAPLAPDPVTVSKPTAARPIAARPIVTREKADRAQPPMPPQPDQNGSATP
jgi:hypothetical protein